jgi:hypothetical protein
MKPRSGKLNVNKKFNAMKILKFILLWIVLTIIMFVSWSLGSIAGNAITQSNPPPVADASSVAIPFFMVCLITSFFLAVLFWCTRSYAGRTKWTALTLYLFVVHFFLPQMETFFFAESLGISLAQTSSIIVTGAIVCLFTVSTGILLFDKLSKGQGDLSLYFPVSRRGRLIVVLILLSCVVYPLIYVTFGYYIAWQNENLRVFYSKSAELDSFFAQLPNFFSDGIYLFQVLRALIWIIFSLPVILMLQRLKPFQYLLVGFLSALPTVQLFIPNPYMPADVAMSHFIETSLSNFLWGVIMAFSMNRVFRSVSQQYDLT